MGWNHLPIELVHLIISNSNLQQHDLTSLVRVDRCLAEIVPQYLCRNVQFISAYPSWESECLCLENLARFNRSITRNPRLAWFTWSIAIRTYAEEDDTVGCIWEVLAKLYALEKLVLSTVTEDTLGGRRPAVTRRSPTMERPTSLKMLTLRVPSEASLIYFLESSHVAQN